MEEEKKGLAKNVLITVSVFLLALILHSFTHAL